MGVIIGYLIGGVLGNLIVWIFRLALWLVKTAVPAGSLAGEDRSQAGVVHRLWHYQLHRWGSSCRP